MPRKHRHRIQVSKYSWSDFTVAAYLVGSAEEKTPEILRIAWWDEVCKGEYPLPVGIESVTDLAHDTMQSADSFVDWLIKKRGFKELIFEDVHFD